MARATFSTTSGMDPITYVTELGRAAMVTAADAKEAAELLKSRIKGRADLGRDYRDGGFAPYSKSYIRDKEAHTGSASPVNLRGWRNEAHMLDTITTTVNGRHDNVDGIQAYYFEVGWIDEDEIANRARWNNEGTRTCPQREFFKASPEDTILMGELLNDRRTARVTRLARK